MRIIFESKIPEAAKGKISQSEKLHNLFILPVITRVRTMEKKYLP